MTNVGSTPGNTFAFTGTKQGMTEAQRLAFGLLLVELKPKFMNNGDCVGADAQAQEMCIELSFGPKIRMYPAFELGHAYRYGRYLGPPHVVYMHKVVAPLTCNKLMVDAAQYVIATPAENAEVLRSGTWATVRYTVTRGKKLYIIMPDGKVEQ